MRFTVTVALAISAATGAPAQTPQSAPKTTYIQAGALLARPGEAPRGHSTIIVRGDKIAEVRDCFVSPEAGAELVDLRNQFVLPGLIDMHVHFYSTGYTLQARLNATSRDRGDAFVDAVGNARRTLDAGFTTVRDLGA